MAAKQSARNKLKAFMGTAAIETHRQYKLERMTEDFMHVLFIQQQPKRRVALCRGGKHHRNRK